MRRFTLFILIAVILYLLFAFAPSGAETMFESGYLNGSGDSYTFVVTNPGGNVNVTFDYPESSAHFMVKVKDEYGILREYDLNKGKIITLSGSGDFYITIYSNIGSGEWTATYETGIASDPTSPEEITPPLHPYTGTPVPATKDVKIKGYLKGTGDEYVFKIPLQSNYLEVLFDYPMGDVVFHVRVVGDDRMTVLGDFELQDEEVIQLYGSGNFYITVYSKIGRGPFSATFNPMGTAVPESMIIAKGELFGTWDHKEFEFEAEADGVKVLFEHPENDVDFWVKISGEGGKKLLGDFDLKQWKIINLHEKGKYLINVYSRGGRGHFRAFYFGGEPTERMAIEARPPDEVESPKFPEETPPIELPDIAKLPPGVSMEKGYLSETGSFKTFIVNAEIDYVEVTFTYPIGKVDFWVKVLSEDGRSTLIDVDLDDGNIIQLMGGGIFYVKIYSKDGVGEWSAIYNEGKTGPYGVGGGMSSRPPGYVY